MNDFIRYLLHGGGGEVTSGQREQLELMNLKDCFLNQAVLAICANFPKWLHPQDFGHPWF
ncbi:MAG: hypothetical protein KGL39_19540 [Patescibacteria group bacterium]|nr:hypothetical protein [Patescibacteria group bacterium]